MCYSSTRRLDQCGICNGNNACFDCFGLPYGSAQYDVCNICGGNNNPIEAIDPSGWYYLIILMKTAAFVNIMWLRASISQLVLMNLSITANAAQHPAMPALYCWPCLALPVRFIQHIWIAFPSNEWLFGVDAAVPGVRRAIVPQSADRAQRKPHLCSPHSRADTAFSGRQTSLLFWIPRWKAHSILHPWSMLNILGRC